MEEIRRLIDERFKTWFDSKYEEIVQNFFPYYVENLKRRKVSDKEIKEEIFLVCERDVAKEWFYDFAKFLKRSNLSNEQIKESIEVMMDNISLANMIDDKKSEEHFSTEELNLEQEQEFFKYLESISSRVTPQYVLDGIEFAKKNLEASSNFMDSFIKYIVITNFGDIRVDSDVPVLKKYENEWGSVSCKLGNFSLAQLDVRKDECIPGKRNIIFNFVLTRANLRNTRIGALLFRRLQGDVAHYFPGHNLYADTVYPRNYGAIRFYESMGAEIIKSEDPYEDSDYIAFFPTEKLQELSEIPVEPPQLEYYTNLPTEGSPTRALREYIGNIIQEQKQYIDAGKEVPLEFRIPEQIELSPQNLDYLLESGAIDFIVEGEKEDEMQFFWKKTVEYPELELRAKRNSKGKFVLTYIKECSIDGKEEFVWDGEDKEGKNGILVISRKDDALEELIDMDR